MSTQQRIELQRRLRAMPQPQGTPTIGEERAGFAAMMESFPVAAVRTSPTELAGLPALLVEPEVARRDGTILYFHGGSWAVGSPATALPVTAGLVAASGVSAVSVDYRLAPEHPFPAGVEDCFAAYRALLDRGSVAGGIVVAGDSAGGGLSVTTSLLARDAGLPLPAGMVLFSPGLDQTRTGGSLVTKAGRDPFFTAASLAASGERYLAGADPELPLASPAVTADLAGLPPVLIQVGTDELLLDDSVRFAARARDAEVDVILDVVAGVPHVFPALTGDLDEAGQALERAGLFVRQLLSA